MPCLLLRAALSSAVVLASVAAQPALLVTDSGLQAVVRVDPATGDRVVVSGATVGSGTNLDTPRGIDIEAGGTIVVCDEVLDVVFRIDPGTGNRTVVSSASVGSGVTFHSAQDLIVEPGGGILVSCSTATEPWAVLRIDPVTGNRTVVSSPSVGAGPAVNRASDLVQDGADLLLIDNLFDYVFRMDPASGDRTLVSTPTMGSGMVFEVLSGLAVAPGGDIVVTDAGFSHDPIVGRVDPITGDRVIVSSPSVGGGPAMVTPFAVVVEPCGDLLVLDNQGPFVLRVDPTTGARTLLSASSVGGGPNFSAPRDMILAEPGACATVVSQGAGCGSLSLTAVGRPVQGSTAVDFQVTTGNIPGTALSHVGIVGLSRPALPLDGLGMPGCFLHASATVLSFEFPITAPGHTWTPLTLPAGPVFFDGFEFNCQGAVFGTNLNNAFGLGVLTSNGLKCTVGAW